MLGVGWEPCFPPTSQGGARRQRRPKDAKGSKENARGPKEARGRNNTCTDRGGASKQCWWLQGRIVTPTWYIYIIYIYIYIFYQHQGQHVKKHLLNINFTSICNRSISAGWWASHRFHFDFIPIPLGFYFESTLNFKNTLPTTKNHIYIYI